MGFIGYLNTALFALINFSGFSWVAKMTFFPRYFSACFAFIRRHDLSPLGKATPKRLEFFLNSVLKMAVQKL